MTNLWSVTQWTGEIMIAKDSAMKSAVEEALDLPSRRALTILFAFPKSDLPFFTHFSLDKKILRGIFHNTSSYRTFYPI
jgi:hypothetical protein